MKNTRVSILILRIVLGLVTGGYSLALVVHQLHNQEHLPLLLLALAELIAAILLLIPRTVRFGGLSLIAVVAVAAAFHLLHGEYSIGFLAVYAAAAFAVADAERAHDR